MLRRTPWLSVLTAVSSSRSSLASPRLGLRKAATRMSSSDAEEREACAERRQGSADSSSSNTGTRRTLVRNPSAPRVSSPHMAFVNVEAAASELPRRPPQAHLRDSPSTEVSPVRGGGALVTPRSTPSNRSDTSPSRTFSTTSGAAWQAPRLSPAVEIELSDALAQAQDDAIARDELEPLAEVSPPSPSTPSFWDTIFPVPSMLPLKRSSTTAELEAGPDQELRRSRTLDARTQASTSLLPSWLSPSSTPKLRQGDGQDGIGPTDGNDTFLDTITRLRSLLGLTDNEAPEDWVKSHRAEIDEVVRKAERDEALNMAKRRAAAARAGRKQQPFDYAAQFMGEDGSSLATASSDTPDGKASEGEPEEQILRMQQEWISPKLPVVFCHGLFGFDVLGPRSVPALTINYWRGIIDILQSNGTEVLVTRVPMSASIADRAAALKEQIEAHFDEGQEINLIGHSMGGLDCRYMISKLGLGVEGGAKVRARSLTTIATPHRGSTFADYMLDEVIGKERLPFLLNALDRIGVPGGGAAFENLTVRAMAKFNEEVKDSDSVRYFSWGAAFNPGLFNEFRIPHGIIYSKEGPNDGLVSVQSSMWGTYQGTLRGVSHLHLIGWVSKVQNTLRDLVGKRRVFDPAAFFLQCCEDMAHAGF